MPVRLAGGRGFTLLLHTTDGVRQTPRARGIDGQARLVHGMLEAPAAVLRARDAATKAFVARYLTGRFTKADLHATTKQLVFSAQGWTFVAS